MKKTRSYVMTARADQVAQTRERILRAALGRTNRMPLSAVSLADIASDAGVSVQTVLRQFGSRDALIDAGVELTLGEIVEELHVPQTELADAITLIVDHHENRGDAAILLLGQETSDPQAARITTKGRAMHRTWVESAFTPLLGDLTAPEREEMIDMLVIATDVYTWKILRRDRGLTSEVVLERMTKLAEAVVGRWRS